MIRGDLKIDKGVYLTIQYNNLCPSINEDSLHRIISYEYKLINPVQTNNHMENYDDIWQFDECKTWSLQVYVFHFVYYSTQAYLQN